MAIYFQMVIQIHGVELGQATCKQYKAAQRNLNFKLFQSRFRLPKYLFDIYINSPGG